VGLTDARMSFDKRCDLQSFNFTNSGFSILVSGLDIVSSRFPPQISGNFVQEGFHSHSLANEYCCETDN